MTSNKPQKAKGESGLSLLQGLSILAIIGVILSVVFKYISG